MSEPVIDWNSDETKAVVARKITMATTTAMTMNTMIWAVFAGLKGICPLFIFRAVE